MTYDRRSWEARQLHALKEEIAGRLRAVCKGIPDEQFDELVHQIARIQRKYEQLRTDELSSRDVAVDAARSAD